MATQASKSKTKTNFDSPQFERRRYYLDVFAVETNLRIKAQIDSGADVSVISESVVNVLYPDWKNAPSAGEMQVHTVEGKAIKSQYTRWLNLSFTKNLYPMSQKFVIMKEGEEFLLGADFLFDFKVCISQRDNDSVVIFPPEYSVRRRRETVTLYVNNPDYVASIIGKVILQPFGKSIAEFELNEDMFVSGKEQLVSVGHMETDNQHVYAIPSLDKLKDRKRVRAALINLSPNVVEINSGSIKVWVEGVETEDRFLLTPDNVTPEELQTEIKKINACVVKQVISTVPVLHKGPGPDVKEKKSETEALDPFDPTLEGYYDETDVVEFGLEESLAKEQLFADHRYEETNINPMDKIPYDDIDPAFHGIARDLFGRFKSIMSLHPYDIGNVSPSLGDFFLPLAKQVPKTHKVYSGSPTDMKILKNILDSMVHYKIIAPSTATYGAPVFLIKRKDPQSPMRLLVAICDLNDCVVKPVSTLPSIVAILETLAKDGVGLCTVVDLAAGFYSVKVAKNHQSRITLLTPYGIYKCLRCIMGLTSVPHVFNSLVFKALHTKCGSGEDDMIEGVWSYMDDISIVTREVPGDPEATIRLHFEKVERVFYRLAFHKFKINPLKIQFFKTRAMILGHILEGNQVKVDPKRIQKMKDLPMPTTLVGWQRVGGLSASLQHYQPLTAAKAAAIMAEMTKQGAVLQQRHIDAFALWKETLSTHPWTLDIADPKKMKVLFTDASHYATGAILFEVDFDMKFVKPMEPAQLPDMSFTSDDVIHRYLVANKLDVILSLAPEPNGDDLFKCLVDQVRLLQLNNFSNIHFQELRVSLIRHLESLHDIGTLRKLVADNIGEWISLVNSWYVAKTDPDVKGLLLQATAHFFNRVIIVVYHDGRKGWITPYSPDLEDYVHEKPAMWIGCYVTYQGSGVQTHEYVSLINKKPNVYSTMTSDVAVQCDIRDMTEAEIKVAVKDFFMKQKAPAHRLKVIAYSSKVVAKVDLHKTILEKECAALLQALNQFKPYIQSAPSCVTFTDNRAGYFLYSPGTFRTANKTRRWNVLMSHEYPNLILLLIPSTCNWSDLLSRLFIVPTEATRQLETRGSMIVDIPDLHFALMTGPELERYCIDNPTIGLNPDLVMSSTPSEDKSDPLPDNEKELISHSEENGTIPLKTIKTTKALTAIKMVCFGDFPCSINRKFLVTLAQPDDSRIARLKGVAKVRFNDIVTYKKYNEPDSPDRVAKCHELMTTLGEHLIHVRPFVIKHSIAAKTVRMKNQETLTNFINPVVTLRNRLSHAELMPYQDELPDNLPIVNGLKVHPDGGIFIPPFLEGIVLAYMHLLSGHGSTEKMLGLIKSRYYFPNRREKCMKFVKQCQPCLLVNPLTEQKSPLGEMPVPAHAYETVTLDLMEGLPKNSSRYVALLIITCYLTKMVHVYPLRDKTAGAVIPHFDTFVMATNASTKYVYSDGGPCFIAKEFQKKVIGYNMIIPEAIRHSPRSHGSVESMVKVITHILRKLLESSEDSYDCTRLYTMAAILHNNSYSPTIGCCPAELVFPGLHITKTGPLAPQHSVLPHRTVAHANMQSIAAKEMKELQIRFAKAKEHLEVERQKVHDRFNKSKRKEQYIHPGDIVFLKQMNPPAKGTSKKFRPYLHSSPFVVTSANKVYARITRLADGLEIKPRVDFLRKYHPDTDQILNGVPEDVMKILQKPLDMSSFKALAEKDNLPPIYLTPDGLPEETSVESSTLAAEVKKFFARRKKKRQAVEEVQEIDDLVDYHFSQQQKSVSFADMTSESEGLSCTEQVQNEQWTQSESDYDLSSNSAQEAC